MERDLGSLEGTFKSVILQIEKDRCIPKNQEDLETLFSIMGLFAIRIPSIRDNFKHVVSETYHKTINLLLKDKATYEDHFAKAYKNGYIDKDIISYEKTLSFYQSGKYSIKCDSIWVLKELFEKGLLVSKSLSQRNWMVVEAPGPYFITSNKPVNPFWATSLPAHLRSKNLLINPKFFSTHPAIVAFYMPYNETSNMFPFFVPGYETTNSIITFPITPFLALIGSWSPLPSYGKIDYLTAQAINWVTANSGADYVYSPKKLDQLPWKSDFIPCLQNYHTHLGSRLIN